MISIGLCFFIMYEKAIEMYEYAIKFDPKNNYSYYDENLLLNQYIYFTYFFVNIIRFSLFYSHFKIFKS